MRTETTRGEIKICVYDEHKATRFCPIENDRNENVENFTFLYDGTIDQTICVWCDRPLFDGNSKT